jgi:hypothetical protein
MLPRLSIPVLFLGLFGYLLYSNYTLNRAMFSSSLAVEAVSVGIILVLMGVATKETMKLLVDLKPPGYPSAQCSNWNKYYAMEISLFVTGVLSHLMIEMLGLNHWYLRNGNVKRYPFADNMVSGLIRKFTQ